MEAYGAGLKTLLTTMLVARYFPEQLPGSEGRREIHSLGVEWACRLSQGRQAAVWWGGSFRKRIQSKALANDDHSEVNQTGSKAAVFGVNLNKQADSHSRADMLWKRR